MERKVTFDQWWREWGIKRNAENEEEHVIQVVGKLKDAFESDSKKVKLATVVVGDSKAPFSIATTPRCWGGCYSFPWIAPLYP